MKTNPFDQFTYDDPLESVSVTDSTPAERPLPNQRPTVANTPYRIAIIGECPSRDDVLTGKPFQGASGRFLSMWLSRAGIVRDSCFIGNICQHRPSRDDIRLFARDGVEIQDGLKRLSQDLNDFSPNICLLLGRLPLWAALGVDSLGDWRGSVFISTIEGPFKGRKCIASYHPTACLRQYEWAPLLFFDIKKCLAHAKDKNLTLPHRELRVNLSVNEIIAELEKVKAAKMVIALDIEGYVDAMSCLSIATSPTYAFIVPFSTKAGSSLHTAEEETRLWRVLASVLEDPTIPKVLQNSLYDRFVLQYSYKLVVRGVVDDTMLRHWELYCELEKNLGFQASIYTDEPFYKSDRKTDDLETFWTYCCKDSVVTHEINGRLSRFLDPRSDQHYRFNMTLLNPLMYMENRGIRYDVEAAKQCLTDVNHHLYNLQSKLDAAAGLGFDFTSSGRVDAARTIMGFKRNPLMPKKEFEQDYDKIISLLEKESTTAEEQGYINSVLGTSMNLKSPMFKEFLYDKLGLPKQYKTDPKTGLERLSTDYVSLLQIQKKQPHPAVDVALELSMLRTRAQMLEISADKDGRVRCGYNIVGTETGRLTCYTSPTGSGYNLQTIPSKDKSKPEGHPLRNGMRHLFQADPGHYMFQCDLSGADGWTIGAHLAALGDRTMLDDLLARIKPAARICYMLRHGNHSLAGKPRTEIKELLKEVKGDDWDYFVCKQGIWGTCYLLGPDKLGLLIAIGSEGKRWMSRNEVKDFQNAVFTAYRVKLLHESMKRKLDKEPVIVSSSGHKRRFFGRPGETLGQALSHEPQSNTTYATNLAMYRLWTDPENRITPQSSSSHMSSMRLSSSRTLLRIEPLHQVHDALLGQFKIEDTAWAVGKIKQWFDNPIIIAGQKITIPFEGNYGPSWGQLDVGTI